jgi:2-C-methyl-D-erythritol 4-phosphate cytidylyltransferase / 2-C-methyl-D-erythritol 2,4-cyclodiphosphate synthase
MMTTAALIVAAGKGERAGGALPKQFQHVAGAALIAHAVDSFIFHGGIDSVHIVIAAGQEEMLALALNGRSVGSVIIGGAERQDSVRLGLDAIAAAGGCDQVMIHDAARPFLPSAVIDRLLNALETSKGAVPVLPVVDTLANGSPRLGPVVPREGLYRIQTPQAAHFESIMTAHRLWTGAAATDDAQMLRSAGFDVAMVEGDAALEKITAPADFARADAMKAKQMISRTGMGYDVHRLETGQELWLCGIQIPYERGLSGHSDADVALHALTDALLGAIAAGDIGDHFSPSDPQWRGAASSLFLEYARDLILEKGGFIDHVDLTLICEAPRIGPHRDAMRHRIADLLRVSLSSVSVKATTTERLGFTGRGEGIAAQAVASVRTPTASDKEA